MSNGGGGSDGIISSNGSDDIDICYSDTKQAMAVMTVMTHMTVMAG